MKTTVLPASQPDAISRAVEILNSGGVVAFPTDTVYGLGAAVFNEQAVQTLYDIKNRLSDKSIPILLASLEDLSRIALNIPAMAATLAGRYWPGPLTLVVPKIPGLPRVVSADWTVGVRIPGHVLARALLEAAGPLAVTSANLSGQTNSISASQVLAQLDGRIPLILDGGQTSGGTPSTVVDCTGEEPKILREGPILASDILRLLGMG